MYLTGNEDNKKAMKNQIYRPVFEELMAITDKYFFKKDLYRKYSSYLSYEDIDSEEGIKELQQYLFYEDIDSEEGIKELQQLKEDYHNASIAYAGAGVPYLLENIVAPFYEPSSNFDRILKKDWGLRDIPNSQFDLHFEYTYFSSRDWEDIIIKNINDSLLRSESRPDLWQMFLQTYRLYESRKNPIFSLFSENVQSGYVYIIRKENSTHYKIGWTSDSNIEKRCKNLQTGSPEKLFVTGYFPASSQKTEKVIHKYFSKYHITGEWFNLTKIQVENILNYVWRQQNNIF